MSRKTTLAKMKGLVCKLTMIVLSLTLGTSSFACPVQIVGTAQQQISDYDISPSSGAPGEDLVVMVNSHEPNIRAITDTTRLIATGGMKVLDIKMITGTALTATLSIPPNALTRKYDLFLIDKEGKDGSVIGKCVFEIAVPGRGNVPPIGPAGVSTMWTVIPENVAHSNFGHRIAGDYYAVLVQIQNYSGFDIQIVGVGFTRAGTIMSPAVSRIMPNNMYRSTRGTLERQQEIGFRATALHIIKTVGTVYTGFLPFWKAPGPKANAGFAGNILNGPFTVGFESIFPDTTVRQLVRLDDQTLRDGLVIKNGTAEKTTVFVPKRILNISNKLAISESPINNRPDNNKVDWKNDPEYVAKKLGDLVIEGVPLSYGQTIKITANEVTPKLAPPAATGATPQPVAASATPQPVVASATPSTEITSADPPALKQGADQVVVFVGKNLQKVTLIPPPDSGIEIPVEQIKPDANGLSMSAKVIIKETCKPGSYKITVSNPSGGSSPAPVIIKVEAKSAAKVP